MRRPIIALAVLLVWMLAIYPALSHGTEVIVEAYWGQGFRGVCPHRLRNGAQRGAR